MFLSAPNPNRLWLLVAGLLITAAALLFISLQVPWYTATYELSELEARALFDMSEASFEILREGEEFLADPVPNQAYGDDSPFGEVMSRTGILMGAGLVGVVALSALAYLHRSGTYSSPGLIKTSWIVGVGGLVGGVMYFTLNAASAGADEVFAQLQRIGQHPSFEMDFARFGSPEPVFWGAQDYAGGVLVSSPGAGWLLAILAVLNLILATLLLYRFPAQDPERDEAAAAGFEAVPEDTAVGPRQPSATAQPLGER